MTFYLSTDNLLPIVYVCLGVALVAMAWLLTVYRSRITCVIRQSDKDNREMDSDHGQTDGKFPSLSVIVYVRDNARDLEQMLPLVLGQEYPAEVEVVVVNDGSSEDVTDVVKLMTVNHKNIYQTFVPEEAHNLSRKKLAISLGIKAARKTHIVVTSAICRPASSRWLYSIGRHFAEGKDMVLGWADIDSLGGRMMRFDETATGVTWLSSAIKGKPYRGNGYNIAYSRELFFEAKGFSSSLNLHNGEDDLFVNQVATADNCAVELSHQGRVTVYPFRPAASYRERRLNHCFTGRFIPHGSRRLMGFSSWMVWLWTAAVAVGILFSLPNVLPAIVFALLIPLLWVPLCMSWRKAGAALGVKLASTLVWWQVMWRWTFTFPLRLLCGTSKRNNYTWRQKK